MLGVEGFEGNDALLIFLFFMGSGKTRIGGNKGGAILRAHQKKILARFHIIFLKLESFPV
jgi:hypothetical protein